MGMLMKVDSVRGICRWKGLHLEGLLTKKMHIERNTHEQGEGTTYEGDLNSRRVCFGDYIWKGPHTMESIYVQRTRRGDRTQQ